MDTAFHITPDGMFADFDVAAQVFSDVAVEADFLGRLSDSEQWYTGSVSFLARAADLTDYGYHIVHCGARVSQFGLGAACRPGCVAGLRCGASLLLSEPEAPASAAVPRASHAGCRGQYRWNRRETTPEFLSIL